MAAAQKFKVGIKICSPDPCRLTKGDPDQSIGICTRIRHSISLQTPRLSQLSPQKVPIYIHYSQPHFMVTPAINWEQI